MMTRELNDEGLGTATSNSANGICLWRLSVQHTLPSGLPHYLRTSTATLATE